MTYDESVHYLYSLGNEIQTAKLGLERISTLLAALGNPHRGPRFIHIAGTNGKGSTAGYDRKRSARCGTKNRSVHITASSRADRTNPDRRTTRHPRAVRVGIHDRA